MLFLLPIVFGSGILTVLSPCVLPILPIILSSGADGNHHRINGTILGLIASFTGFAFLIASLISLLNISAADLRISSAIILGLLGLTMIFPSVWEKIQTKIEPIFNIPVFGRKKRQGFWGGFLTGVILGVVWTPCVGPIVAAATTLASTQAFSFGLLAVLVSYSIGIALPLLLIAKSGARISEKVGWYKKNQEKVKKYFGVIILATALFIATGAERKFQSLVLDYLPESIANPVGNFEQVFSDKIQLLEKDNQKVSTVKNEQKIIIDKKIKLKIEDEGAKIALSEIVDGCPNQDCIPSIDEPIFESVEEADDWLTDSSRVFILDHNGITKIYPQNIMGWHEIVNDWFNDEPIAVTYCPLCGTSTAFTRVVDNVITEFGVSGKLHNSDLIMYDRYEGSLWQQLTGEAITGPAARRNASLNSLFLIALEWQDAKTEFPKAKVLSRETGYSRDYNVYFYESYANSEEVGFSCSHNDKRLGAKEWVYGIKIGSETKAYKESDLQNISVIKDIINNTTVLVKNNNGIISFSNLDTGEEIVPLRSYWFAWTVFNPGTKLYKI